MRIGILANTFERVFGDAAGGHVHFIEVAKRWTNVDVVVFGPAEARETIVRELPSALFVTMPSTDLGTGSSQIRNLSRVILGLRRLRELRACDTLIASSHFLPDIVPAFLAKGGRTVVCIHHIIGRSSEPGRDRLAYSISLAFQSIALSAVRMWGRVVIANHPETLRSIGFRSPGVHIVQMRHGVDHLQLKAMESPSLFDAVYLGRLVPVKNLEDILSAWVQVVEAYPQARLAIAGGGDPAYVAALRARMERLQISHAVDFLGRVSNERREALYGGARIFVLASKEEGWGIVLAEAMAHGLPCVTYDLPAFRRDFFGGRMVVPVGDVQRFASAIIELLGNVQLRERLGVQARDMARAFRWEDASRTEMEALTLAANQ